MSLKYLIRYQRPSRQMSLRNSMKCTYIEYFHSYERNRDVSQIFDKILMRLTRLNGVYSGRRTSTLYGPDVSQIFDPMQEEEMEEEEMEEMEE